MVYCLADIHGEIDRFHKMLELINFSEQDTMYIIGDVIDRYPGGIDILKEIMDKPNITLIIGNHEHMMLDSMAGAFDRMYHRGCWQNNGGDVTYIEWMNMTSDEEKKAIKEYLLNAPDHLDIEVNNQKYHLVHGFPGGNTPDRVWGRPNESYPYPWEDQVIAIIGHTPTCYIEKFDDQMSIVHRQWYIDIDCGCGHDVKSKRLACLRLDDMKEFYA